MVYKTLIISTIVDERNSQICENVYKTFVISTIVDGVRTALYNYRL